MSKMLGYEIFDKSKKDLIEYVLNEENNKKLHIISGNPEVLNSGLENKELFNNFTSKEAVIIPDGVGVVISAKIRKDPVREKIAGIEVFDEILNHCNETGKGIYLLGAKEETLKKCIERLNIKYPNLKILGQHNGFFDINNCEELISDINSVDLFALFVAMGAPRQEKFIVKYMDRINSKIFMGVGGSFDVISGTVNRAPKFMISLGLEWLYRVSKEPYRIKRLGVIPKFILKAIKE